MPKDITRRNFIGAAAVAPAVFQVVPSHILGRGKVPPSEKITMAHIGCGTEGIRELPPLLASPDIQIVAVCDPNKDSNDYVDWSKDGLRNDIRKMVGNPKWREGATGIPGGRDVGKEVIEAAYARQENRKGFKGVATYADFRELLEKEKDVDAVKIMTPDHLHATISLAAMKSGKHVLMHKPVANRVRESRLVVAAAKETGVATNLLAWDGNGSMDPVMSLINGGAIGKLRQVHNWSNRPIWPQYAKIPTDTPPVPAGFDWDLWLGPAADRPYHPHYTHAVFRGWYDFGGGPIADMGHYSLWSVFNALDLGIPTVIEANATHACEVKDQVSGVIQNDYSFPVACTIRFKFKAKGDQLPIELFWYDGGIKPVAPDELGDDALPAEGMMFVGDKGKILAGFNCQNPRVLTGAKDEAVKPQKAERHDPGQLPSGVQGWIKACRDGQPGPGNFADAANLSETINLGAVALRAGKRLVYDAEKMEITNVPEANKYLTREYRPGWEL